MSLKPGSQVAESYSEVSKDRQSRSASAQLGYIQNQLLPNDGSEDGNRTADGVGQMAVVNGDGYSLCSPPRTENEVRERLCFVWGEFLDFWVFETCVIPFFSLVPVCSCSWSSTSSRRRSDGWGSCSTRGTCTSGSWSWRLRTWKTLTTPFKTGLMRRCPLLTPAPPHPPHSYRGPDTPAGVNSLPLFFRFHLSLSLLSFCSFHAAHISFLYIHVNTPYPLICTCCTTMQVYCTFFLVLAFLKYILAIEERREWWGLPWLNVWSLFVELLKVRRRQPVGL